MIKTHPTGRPFLRVALICSTASCSASSLADVSVPSVFSDHMVLQRDLPIPVWGTASPGEEISVTFGNQNRSAKADSQGAWRVDPTPASTVPQKLEISGSRMNLNLDSQTSFVALDTG
jgi:sialate O-acetylesterase